MQAVLYDSARCDTEPVAIVEESVQALELTGNANLLLIPSQFLPQCASLYVNNQPTEYHISLATENNAKSETPYLQLSAYLSEECGDTPDLQISLIADETLHPVGQFEPQAIREMRQTFNPDMMQTQQFDEDQTPVTLYYKATITGTITVFSSPNGKKENEIMSVPLQQFMDTCFNQASPFPGFSNQNVKGRSGDNSADALRSLVDALGSRTVHSDLKNGGAQPNINKQRGVQPQINKQRAVHPQINKQREIEEETMEQRGVHPDINKQRGLHPDINKQREIGDETMEQRGFHPDINKQRGLHPDINKQREIGDETIEQRGVHPDINKQRGLHPDINKQREIGDETIEQRGVHPDINKQRGVHPDINKQREIGDETIEQRGVHPDINKQRGVHTDINKQREIEDELDQQINQDSDHIANLFAGFNDHVRSRSQQGLPVSFKITASIGQLAGEPSMQDQEWSTIGHDKPGHGKHGPKHHGLDRYMTPCQQEAGLMILGVLAILVVIRMMMSQRQARASPTVSPQMQERPIEKKNKDYVAVPTSSV